MALNKITPHSSFTKGSPWRDKRGTATGDLLWVLAVVAALWILWFATGGTERPAATAGPFIKPPPPISTGEIYSGPRPTRSDPGASTSTDPTRSPWFGQVTIRAGSARYEIQPNREFIELATSYQLKIPVTITGWLLSNGRNRRGGQSDFITLPSAAKLFTSGATSNTPIILEPGGRVVIITGNPPASDKWPARVNFQTNRCLGYLSEDFRDFRLPLFFSGSCPAPRQEPGLEQLADDCYDVARRWPACRTPEFRRDSEGYELLDGRRTNLSSQCRNYLTSHFSYSACLYWHKDDPDFYGKDWRVYLNRTGELWAANREVITLFDREGKIVDQVAY